MYNRREYLKILQKTFPYFDQTFFSFFLQKCIKKNILNILIYNWIDITIEVLRVFGGLWGNFRGIAAISGLLGAFKGVWWSFLGGHILRCTIFWRVLYFRVRHILNAPYFRTPYFGIRHFLGCAIIRVCHILGCAIFQGAP